MGYAGHVSKRSLPPFVYVSNHQEFRRQGVPSEDSVHLLNDILKLKLMYFKKLQVRVKCLACLHAGCAIVWTESHVCECVELWGCRAME